jgi:hypothetical protein
VTLGELFPDARPFVLNIVNIWPAYIIKPQFAWWEVLHILSLIVLGGSSILLNLRLLGVGITDEPPSEVGRNMRPWLHVGIAGIIVTGILIGMANAERLYDSPAFIVKMLGLVGGIVLTYGASLPTARTEGAVGTPARVWTVLGLVLWGLALWVFATAMGNAPGVWHVLTAGALILFFATRGRLRLIYLAVLALILAVQFLLTHVGVGPDEIAKTDPVNKAVTWAVALWMITTAAAQIFTSPRDSGGPLTKVIAYSTILVWVTAAAAGRWIAFA